MMYEVVVWVERLSVQSVYYLFDETLSLFLSLCLKIMTNTHITGSAYLYTHTHSLPPFLTHVHTHTYIQYELTCILPHMQTPHTHMYTNKHTHNVHVANIYTIVISLEHKNSCVRMYMCIHTCTYCKLNTHTHAYTQQERERKTERSVFVYVCVCVCTCVCLFRCVWEIMTPPERKKS